MNELETMNLKEEESLENPFPISEPDDLLNIEDDQESLITPEKEIHAGELNVKEGTEFKKEASKEKFSSQFENFKAKFDQETQGEAKLQLVIGFMETSLAQEGTPHFRSFWEARRLCLPLFKEKISPFLRSQLWTKYSELSKEARRLKDMLDEQSAFAVEQIEIAIQSLETEVAEFEERASSLTLSESLVFPRDLKQDASVYEKLQSKLSVLNTQAARINGMRKELLRTEMRVRHKNKFFQRLSIAGDHVFPKRKELIREMSQKFLDDVHHFIEKYFGEHPTHEALYILREEIKAFQGLAKVLTLNTHAFTQTRTQLSQCWDRIKEEEKERKKERAHQRLVFKQNFEELDQQIATVKESFEKNESSVQETQKKLEEIVAQMRKVDLGRDELKSLREALSYVRKLIQDKAKTEEESRQQLEYERLQQRKEKYQAVREEIRQLVSEHENKTAQELHDGREKYLTHIQEAPFSKNEKQELERMLKPLRDVITDKKEKEMMELSDDERHALEQLKTVLRQRQERRQEVKQHLELLRKAAGASSLDFEKAMSYTHQIQEEKERLDKVNASIQEVEAKIREVQNKIKDK